MRTNNEMFGFSKVIVVFVVDKTVSVGGMGKILLELDSREIGGDNL